jgi:hypothetical protein
MTAIMMSIIALFLGWISFLFLGIISKIFHILFLVPIVLGVFAGGGMDANSCLLDCFD